MRTHMRDLATWRAPEGGMFFWLTLASQIDSAALLPRAIEQGVSFLPGAVFFAGKPVHHAQRQSFVTEPPDQIAKGVATLARIVRTAPPAQSGQAQ
jgi:2-aminoadipate transaminase